MSQVPGSSPAAPAVSSSDTAPTIESVLQEGRSFEPPAELAARARDSPAWQNLGLATEWSLSHTDSGSPGPG